eukprot:3136245-Rhodomonas_salina.2
MGPDRIAHGPSRRARVLSNRPPPGAHPPGRTCPGPDPYRLRPDPYRSRPDPALLPGMACCSRMVQATDAGCSVVET